MSYPQTRQASRQAWARLRRTMSEGELSDIAMDVANVVKAEHGTLSVPSNIAETLRYALQAYPWDEKSQA